MGSSSWWLLFLWNVASGCPGIGSGSRWARELWFLGSRVQAWYLWGTGLPALRHVESSPTRDQMCVSCVGRQLLTAEPPGKPQGVLLARKECLKLPSPTFPASLGQTHHRLCLCGHLRRMQTWAAQRLLSRCHWRLRNPAEWRRSAGPSLRAPW